jgi:hypothetical protein
MDIAYRDKKVVGVFVRFRAPCIDGGLQASHKLWVFLTYQDSISLVFIQSIDNM